MKEKVLIIGGGIAGMEAARQLRSLGLWPIIVEREPALGGHVAGWHRLFPDRTPARQLLAPMQAALQEGVQVCLNTRVISLNRLKDSYSVKLSNGENLVVQAVLMATGFQLFEAERKEEYGYGVYDHVITNADLEAWMNGQPDTRVPEEIRSVGFVHCVGSRDIKAGNPQCSKVCCMTAIKQAIEMRELYPKAEIYCFYMDLRLFGKKYEDFYIEAQRDCGIHFIRGRVSEVGEDIDGRVQVKAEDTLLGKPVKVHLDLLVLMSGMVCNPSVAQLAPMVRLGIDTDGFLRSRDNLSGIVSSGRPGIFFAGACTGTKTIPETLAEARAAALEIYQYLRA